MGIRSTEFGGLLIEQHIKLGNERVFPDRFPDQGGALVGTPKFGDAAGTVTGADRVGYSVSVNGDLAAVGVPYADYDATGAAPLTDAGAVYMYTRSDSNTWTFAYRLTPPTGVNRAASQLWGTAVSLYGGILAVGCPQQTYDSAGANSVGTAGAIYMYEVTNTAGVLKQKITPTGSNSRIAGDLFGTSVAVLGDVVVAGAPYQSYDELGSTTNTVTNAGAVFVFIRNSDTKQWVQTQKVIAQGNSRNNGDTFGNATASDGKTLVVGAPAYDYGATPGLGFLTDSGAAYVFYWSTATNSWTYEGIIIPSTRTVGDRFGDRVAVYGDAIAVSSNIAGAGAVRVYRRTGVGVFAEEIVLTPQTRTVAPATAKFGYSLSLNKNTLVVGAYAQNMSNGSVATANVGNVYVYVRDTAWTLQTDFSVPGYAQSQAGQAGAVSFGFSVSLTDDLLVVGAPTDTTDQNSANPTSNAGSAFLFQRTGTTWAFLQKIVGWGQDRNNSDLFGTTMAYSNGTLVVSAPNHSYDSIGNRYVLNAGAIYVYAYDGTNLTYQQKLTPTGTNARIASDRFGSTLAIDGDTIVAGSIYHSFNIAGSGGGTNPGALWVFKRVNTVWSQFQKIVPTGPNAWVSGDQFGYAVAVQGSTIAASSINQSYDANGATAVTNAGAVYVFDADATTGVYAQSAKVVAQGPGGRVASDQFGISVDYRDGMLIAGSVAHTLDFDGANPLSGAGAAWLYNRTAVGQPFTYVTKFSGWGQDRNVNDYMGVAMAASGDTLAVGVSNHSYDVNSRNFVTSAGAVMIYTWDGVKWNFQAKLTSEANRSTNGKFGRSLSLEGDTLVVGAPGEEIPSGGSFGTTDTYWGNGATYVFVRNFGVWTRQARLLPTGTNATYNNGLRGTSVNTSYNRFGWSVSLSGNLLAVGQPWASYDFNGANLIDNAGAAYVFVRNISTGVWSQEARLSSNMISSDRAAQDLFGYSVSVKDGVLVVGSPYQDYDQDATNAQSDAGAAYVFRRDPAGDAGFAWVGEQKLVGWGQERNVNDALGSSIAGYGGTLVVGAPSNSYNPAGNDFKSAAGAVYVWVMGSAGWTYQQKLTLTGTNNRSTNDRFGTAVAIYGDTLVAASPGYRYLSDGTAVSFNVGAAFVWTRSNGVWTQSQRLDNTAYNRTDTINNGRGTNFGASLAVDHDTIAVGNPLAWYDAAGSNSNILTNSGQVAVFRNTTGSYVLEQTLVAKTRKSSEQFGQQVDLRDNLILVGSTASATDTSDTAGVTFTASGMGGAWVFARTGTTWNFMQKLSSAPVERMDGDQLGYSMSSDGRTLVVGAPYADMDNGIADNTITDAGAAYVYSFINNAWRFESRLVAGGVNARNTNANFGLAVSVSNDTIAVGAPGTVTDAAGNNGVSNAGAAFVFRGAASAITRKTKRRAIFSGTGAAQQFVVPDGVTNINVLMWGAAGGGSSQYGGVGGAGGFVRAAVGTTPGETLTLMVGKGGQPGLVVGSGGGRSELLRSTTTLLVAAGGGGAGNNGSTGGNMTSFGGAGGGDRGEDTLDAAPDCGGGHGGSQTDGGTAGYTPTVFAGSPGAKQRGGDGYTPTGAGVVTIAGGWPNGGKGTYLNTYTWHSAGGGDGWYGGGASSSNGAVSVTTTTSGGGGGSSYVDPSLTGYTLRSTNSFAPEIKRLSTILSTITVGSGFTSAAGSDGVILVEWDEPYTPRVWSQEARIVPTGTNSRISNDQFGYAVSLDANTLIVGAPGQDYDAAGATILTNAGAAWIYERADTTWTQTIKLVGYGTNGRVASDAFGTSVSVSGDVVAVGAPNQGFDETGANSLTNAGATYAWRKIGSTWTPLNKIVGYGRDVDTSNNSGYAMAGDGTYLAVGAPGHDYDLNNTNFFADAGTIYMWSWNGSLWTLEQRIVAPDAFRNTNARFGNVLSLRDDTLVVGAPGTNSQGKLNVGAAHVYRRTNLVAGAPWQLEATLEMPAANVLANASFGASVNYYKDTIAIGSPASQITTGVTDGIGGAVFVFARSGTTWSLQNRLIPTGTNAAATGDQFGYSVSQYDDMLVVGSPSHDWDQDGRNSATDAGAAWVFTRTGGVWTQLQKLIAWGHDRNDADRHGRTLVGSGTTLAACAPFHSYDDQGNQFVSQAGAVYVWTYEGNPATWRLQQKITPTGANARNAGDQFGNAMAISGDLLVIGSYTHGFKADGTVNAGSTGAVWVFRRTAGAPGTKVWAQEAKLVPTGTNASLANDQFGFAIAAENATDTIIVGAPTHDYDAAGANALVDAGAVWYFHRENGTWVQKQKIVAQAVNRGATTTNGRLASDQFGYSVDVRSDIMVIGAPFHDYDQNGRNILTDSGAVFLYSRNSQTGLWEQKQKLVGWGQDRNPGDQYGFAVAGDGTYLAVGAPFQAYDSKSDFYAPNAGAVYMWSYSDGVWSFQQKITALDGPDNFFRVSGDQFGYSLSMSNGYLAVGAPYQDYDAAGTTPLTDAGAAYVFKRVSGLWAFSQKIVPTGTNARIAGDQFGANLSMDDDTLAVAAPLHDWDETGTNSVTDAGAVFVFRRDANDVWALERKLAGQGVNGRVAGDQFGYSLALKSNLLVVGSPYQDYDQAGANALTDSGAAWVFRRVSTTWSFEDKIGPTGLERRAGDRLSASIATNGNWMAVGAPAHTYDRYNRASTVGAGAVYVFQWDGIKWNYDSKVTPKGVNSRNVNDAFGTSVGVWNGYLAVGAPGNSYDAAGANLQSGAGAIWIFNRLTPSGFWMQMTKIVPVGTNNRIAGDALGTNMAFNNGVLVAGVANHSYDVDGSNQLANAGAAFVWTLNTQPDNSVVWQQTTKLIPTGANARNAGDAFGSSVSYDTNVILVGAPAHQYPADGYAGTDASYELPVTGAGAAWLFKLANSTWTQTNKITAFESSRRINDHFGTAVATTSDCLVVGAAGHSLDVNGANMVANAGALYTYNRRTIARNNFLRLNGTTDYADVTSVMTALNNRPYTVAGWFRTNTYVAATQYLWSMFTMSGTTITAQHSLRIQNGALTYVNSLTSGGLSQPITVSDNTWHHLAVTLETSGKATIYIDGAPVSAVSATYATIVPKSTYTFLLGANAATATGGALTTAGEYFAGDVSDFAVWNSPLLPTEVAGLAQGTQTPSNVQSSALYGYWINN